MAPTADDLAQQGVQALKRLDHATGVLRESTKWILTVIAALGSVLIAGLRFADVGQLEVGSLAFWAAISASALALIGVGWIVAQASRVLITHYVTLHEIMLVAHGAEIENTALPASQTNDLIGTIEREQDHLYQGIAHDLTDLFDQIRQTDQQRLAERALGLPPEEAEQRDSYLRELGAAADRVVDFADHWATKERFKALMRALAIGGPLVVLGVFVFALAANRPARSGVQIRDRAIPVTIYFTPEGQRWAKTTLNCGPTQLRAMAVGGFLDKPEVITFSEPKQGCTPKVFVLPRQVGVAVPDP